MAIIDNQSRPVAAQTGDQQTSGIRVRWGKQIASFMRPVRTVPAPLFSIVLLRPRVGAAERGESRASSCHRCRLRLGSNAQGRAQRPALEDRPLRAFCKDDRPRGLFDDFHDATTTRFDDYRTVVHDRITVAGPHMILAGDVRKI